MAKPHLPDLRIRIIRAVEDQGMSCRGAAARFGAWPEWDVTLMKSKRGNLPQPRMARRAISRRFPMPAITHHYLTALACSVLPARKT
jgi:hypothetical protein